MTKQAILRWEFIKEKFHEKKKENTLSIKIKSKIQEKKNKIQEKGRKEMENANSASFPLP